jgi:hypothetical protein
MVLFTKYRHEVIKGAPWLRFSTTYLRVPMNYQKRRDLRASFAGYSRWVHTQEK